MEAQFSSGMCDVNAKFFEIELSPKNVEATERIYIQPHANQPAACLGGRDAMNGLRSAVSLRDFIKVRK